MSTQTAETPHRSAGAAGASCDVVVLTWNRRDLLEPCIARILAHTKTPGRLIIVDNGSTDSSTLDYLRQVQGTPARPVEVVRIPENIGIAAALNVGLQHTTAPWMCLLNNDLLVTDGWLEEMLKVGADPSIGLINPMSNEFGLSPSDDESVDELGRHCRDHTGRWLENWQAIGFCILFSRRVLDEVGYWDAAVGAMFLTDTDYSLQVRRTGRVCAIAEGAYVFHRKSATIRLSPDRERQFRDSWARIQRKWGVPDSQRVACVMPAGEPGRRAAARVRELANQGHEVDVICARDSAAAVARHLLVRVRPVRAGAVWPAALWRIVTKKKRFERILVWSPEAAEQLSRWRWLRGAAVQQEAAAP